MSYTPGTLTANLKIDSAVSSTLRLHATYRYDDRDNETPTDAFPAAPRRNLPYSFTNNTVKLGGDYRIATGTRLSAGYDYEKKVFTNQEVDHTNEDTVWGKVSMRALANFDVTLRVAHAERDASDYNLIAETNPSQNPLLIKYNLADRSRDTGGIQIGFSPHERVSIGLGVDLSHDNYSDSALDLTEGRENSYTADASVMLTDVTNLHAIASREQIESERAGSQGFSTVDWFAKNDDTIDTFGTVQLYADYRLKDNLTLHAAYWYESYDSSDWMLDGVDPDTIPNVISFGEDTPEYGVRVVIISARYRF